METITKNVGFVLIISAFLRLLNVVEYTPVAQLGFAIAALLITLADLKEFKSEVLEKDVIDIDQKKQNKKKLFGSINKFHFWAVFSLITLPNIKFDWFSRFKIIKEFMSWYITNINDFATLLALGLVIYTIALKRNQTYNNKLRETKKPNPKNVDSGSNM